MDEVQKRKATEVANTSTALSLTPISKPSDLVGCTPMVVLARQGKKEAVLAIILAALDKCIMAMDFDVTDQRRALLASDIMETYTHDSIEDVIEALKQGRQLKLERPPHASRSKFSMEYVSHWMSQILDKKSAEREKIRQKEIAEENASGAIPVIDYKAYKLRAAKERENKKGRHASAAEVRKQAEYIIEKHNKK